MKHTSVKQICIDDFGTVWFQVMPRSPWREQKFPAQVYCEVFENDGIEQKWLQAAIIETYRDWGLLTRQEVEEHGFTLRW